MRSFLAVLIVLFLPAAAHAGATATPNTTSSGTQLGIDLDTTAAPVFGRIPTAVVVSVQPGFRFDGRAVAKRCRPAGGGCPPRSKIGSATVTGAALSQTVTVPLDLYLAPPQQPGDLAGIVGVGQVFGTTVSATGRVAKGADGTLQVIVEAPPQFQQYAAVAQAQHVTATVGAHRRVKVKGKRRKVRYDLIRTPSTCTGTWAASAALTFGDGSTAALDAPIACSGLPS